MGLLDDFDSEEKRAAEAKALAKERQEASRKRVEVGLNRFGICVERNGLKTLLDTWKAGGKKRPA